MTYAFLILCCWAVSFLFAGIEAGLLSIDPVRLRHHRTLRDPDPNSTHMGETREERVVQFLEENETPVLGMREGAWVLATQGSVILGGANGARIFRRGHAPVEAVTGEEISGLVGAPE